MARHGGEVPFSVVGRKTHVQPLTDSKSLTIRKTREKSCFHDPPKNASQAEVSTLPRRAAISVSSGTQTFMPLRHNIGSGIAATGHFPPIDDVSATSAFALIAPLRPMNRHKRGADFTATLA